VLGRIAMWASGPVGPPIGGKAEGNRVGPEWRLGCRNLNQRYFENLI
jgi:hypothetical protein